MKRCSSCCNEYPVSNFSPQKTNPAKLYAWCDVCRASHMPRIRPLYDRNEVRKMREKAISMRKFDDTAAAALYKEKQATGLSNVKLAAKHGVSETTVRKSLIRGKRIAN